jgi:DNA polymerase III subunit epsilon
MIFGRVTSRARRWASSRTTAIAEIYRRDASWRLRAVGQGYDDGLAGLATRYGVDVSGG